jgi:hypothetical protein
MYSCQAGPEIIPRSLIQIGSSIAIDSNSRIAAQVRQVEEHMLAYTQSLLARFGLTCWCPDLRQSPYSLYNAACRFIALDTFKQALVSQAYAHLQPNNLYATNMDFQIKLYDHFVHHYMDLRYRKECKRAGSVKVADEASPQYRNRARASPIYLGIVVPCLPFDSLLKLAEPFSKRMVILHVTWML